MMRRILAVLECRPVWRAPAEQGRAQADHRAASGTHRKPDDVRERIERLMNGPYLELFARETETRMALLGRSSRTFLQGAARPAGSRLALLINPTTASLWRAFRKGSRSNL